MPCCPCLDLADWTVAAGVAMADWSQLPPELLTLIAKRLKTRFDVVRFRSVCSSWRSSFPPKLLDPLPTYLPACTLDRCHYSLTHMTRNTCFLLRRLPPPGPDHETTTCCWLVKIRDGVQMGLLDPLSDSELNPLPPKLLDLTKFQVIELAHEFLARYSLYIDHPLGPQSRDYTAKVGLMWTSNANGSNTNTNTNSNDFMMVASFRCLASLRSQEKKWDLLNEPSHNRIRDILSFNGKFYAIEEQGRTIVVDQSLNVAFLPRVGSPDSVKFLVESVDNLLAVEMLIQLASSDSDSPSHFGLGTYGYGGHGMVYAVAGFRIFRLDQEGQKWDEIASLGDQILFLGLRQAITVSCSELSWGRGNLIFYSTSLSILPRDAADSQDDGVPFVFDLETGKATPLKDCPPAYSNLFSPPPELGVTSTLPQVESFSNTSNCVDSATSAAPDIASVGEKPSSTNQSTSSKSSFKFCCF